MKITARAFPPFICALALSAYYYAVSADFRFLFLENGGSMIIRELRSPFEKDIMVFFLASIVFSGAARFVLKRLKIPASALFFFCIPCLFVFSFVPGAVKFPELIPIGAVALPAASLAAFFAYCSVFLYGRRDVSKRTLPPGRDGRIAAVFIFFLVVFFISGYRINETTGYHRGDEGHYLTMARSIAEDFDLDIRNQISGYTPSMRLQVHISPHSPEGYGYSWHPPGLSFVFAPFFRIYEEHRSGKRGALFSLYVMGALLASCVYLAAKEASGSRNIGLFSSAVLMLSSPMWLYSIRAYPMMPGGLCILYCWRKLKGFQGSSRTVFMLFNLLLVWLVWLHDTFLPAFGIIASALLIFWIKNIRDKKLLITLLLQALNLAVFVFFRFRWYGSNFFGQHGGLFNFWPGLFGAWFDFFRGMIFASPVHLLAFILLLGYVVKKRDFYSVVLFLLYMSVYIPGSSSAAHWTGGSSHPGRRLAPCIPLAAVPLAYFMAEKRKYSFYWLTIFLGIISVAYMSYFMFFNLYGFTRPLSDLVLSEQLFRPLDFHLPAFGTGFGNFPWGHFGFSLANISMFILFWVFLVNREKKPAAGCMAAGMAATILWIFVSVGIMKTFFVTASPVPKTAAVNFSRKNTRIAEPVRGGKLFFYALDGCVSGFSYSHRQEGLPHHLDLSRGLYSFRLRGTAPAGAEAEAVLVYVRRGIRMARFPVTAGDAGGFELLKYFHLPAESDAVSIFFPADSEFKADETIVTPVPGWLEALSCRVAETGKRSGFLKYTGKAPEIRDIGISAENFKFSASHAEDSLANITDGDPFTRWTPLKAQSPGMFFEVDMGKEYNVRGIRLGQGEFWKDWARGLAVYASTDGESWEAVYKDDGFGGYVYRDKDDPCFLNMENCVRIFFEPAAARMLKVEQTGKERIYWWSVADFSVLAAP